METLKIDPKSPDADIRMMKTADAWPMMVLPLKQKDPARRMELGLMIAQPGVPRWNVWVLTLGIFDPEGISSICRGELPEGATVYEFDDAEGAFDAGWRVD